METIAIQLLVGDVLPGDTTKNASGVLVRAYRIFPLRSATYNVTFPLEDVEDDFELVSVALGWALRRAVNQRKPANKEI